MGRKIADGISIVRWGQNVSSVAALIGGGSSATPLTDATGSINFTSYFCKTTATSGDVRAAYNRLDLSGAGVQGDAVRAYARATVAGVTGAHGLHATAELQAAGATVTGLMSGVRATLDRASATAASGSLYALIAETFSAVNSQTATEYALALFRTVANGGAGAGTKPAMLFKIGDTLGPVSSGSGDTTLHKTGGNFTCTGGERCSVNGTVVWLPTGTIDATTGLKAGFGSSGTPESTASADKNFLQYYTKTTATSGDSRQYYGRHDINGAGVQGEAIRARCMANVAGVTNAVGGSFTAQLGAAGATIAGLAAGVRATMDLANATLVGGAGDFYGLLVESLSAANSQTWDRHALIGARTMDNGGTGTKCINLLALGDAEGAVTTGTGDTTMLKTGNTLTVAGGIGILVNGARQYLAYGAISTT